MFRKLTIVCISLFIFSSLWYGCVPKPTIHEDTLREKVAAPTAIERQYKSAYEEYKRGELDKAARHFQDFVVQYPRTALTDDALYYLGDIYVQQQEYKVAAIQFERLLSYFPSSPHLKEAQWSLAKCYFKMGAYKDALNLARPLLSAVEDQPLWRGQILVFLGECYAALGDPMASLSWYGRARREIPAAQRDEVRGKIIALLDQDLPPDKYREIMIAYPATFIAYYAKYRLAQSYFSKGKREEAEGLLREAMKEAKGEDFYPRLEAFWRQMQIVPVPFGLMIDPRTGRRTHTRYVEHHPEAYQTLAAYMIRLKPEDFEQPETVAALARAGNMTEAEFMARFGRLARH